MKKVLIVDDDLMIQKIVGDVVKHHFPEFHLLGAVSSVIRALQMIREESPDLILLDIALSDGTAFDLLREVEFYDFKVVFMSGHEDYLQETIQFSAVGFVTKPIDLGDLVLAIDKACDAIDESDYHRKIEILLSNANLPAVSRMVIFPTVSVDKAVKLSSILFGEAVAGGCIIHTENGTDIYVPRPLRYYEQLFGHFGFVRCHPLFVVNLRQIESLDEMNNIIYLQGGMEIPMSPHKYDTIKTRYYEIVP